MPTSFNNTPTAMKDTIDTLAAFGIPEGAESDAQDVRTILARLVDAGEVSIGELQCARDVTRFCGCAEPHAYLLVAAMFMALHSGDAELALTGDAAKDSWRIAAAGRIDRASEEVAVDADGFARLVAAHWPAAAATAGALSRFVVSSGRDGTDAIRLAFRRHHDAAVRVANLLEERAKAADGGMAPQELDAFCTYSRGAFILSGEQKRAVAAAVAGRLAVVTGGPGTGKTTIVCSILRALVRREGLAAGEIALAAPTGRAAQRMGEALRGQLLAAGENDIEPGERAILQSLDGSTIQSLLGGVAPRWRHDATNQLPHRLVVIDEASMVDLLLMRSLLDALRGDCRLILLGDVNQLPPVQAGAVLGDLVCRMRECVAELTQSRRFKGSLRSCAEEFKRGDCTTIMSDAARLGDDWADAVRDSRTIDSCLWFEPRDARAEIDGFLRKWADAHGLARGGALHSLADAIADDEAALRGEMTPTARKLFAALDASRILAVVRNGRFGTERANETLLRHRLGRLPGLRRLAEPGLPVIVTENAPRLRLFNGDTGVTVRSPEGMLALFPRGDRVVACHVSRLPEHDIAYATTVHKSQGSEFGDVLVVMPDCAGHPLLSRRMAYTAITRARWRTVIFSTRAALASSAA